MTVGIISARPSPYPVVLHLLVRYRRTWRASLLQTFAGPVLFLLGMGLSVGTYVDRSGALNIAYLDFLAPGLLASSVFQMALAESTWPVFGSFTWQRMYFAMQASPLRSRDMVVGQELFILFRTTAGGLGFLVAMALFGTLHSVWAVATLPVCVLLTAAASLPLLAFSATIASDNKFSLVFRFGVIPMTLFAGVFFPVSAMPLPARSLAYVSPLWHAVELCRAATLGLPGLGSAALHVAYLGLWAIVGCGLATWRFRVRLKDGGP
jgi:lipooligosaccharide transport system permease protein